MRESMRVVLLTLCTWLMAASAVQATELQWWSHWAIEDNKKLVLFEAKRRFEAKNPGHTVTITFYEKKNMFTTLRAAFTAGSGFPDVVYYDIDAPEFMAAGWLADLSTGIRWENLEPFGKAFWTRPGPGGKIGIWALPIEAASDELYFNKKIFKQLNITVPAGGAFTQEQFKDVVAKCTKAGYAAFATGAADRDWAAHYMPNGMLLDKLGLPTTDPMAVPATGGPAAAGTLCTCLDPRRRQAHPPALAHLVPHGGAAPGDRARAASGVEDLRQRRGRGADARTRRGPR